MPVSTTARHRTSGRPTTVLSGLTVNADDVAVLGRRSAVLAVSSGLIVSGLVAPASAAPSVENVSGDVSGARAVDTSTLTAGARSVLNRAPVVTVRGDLAWNLDTPVPKVVADPTPRAARVTSRSGTRAPVPAALGTTAPNANGSAIIEIAARYVGVPYVWGGTTPGGFDCSGFTSYVFAQLGINLPRTTSGQLTVGTRVSRADAQPGDLISHPGHVGIYAGGNLMVDAPQPGGAVSFRAIYFSDPVFTRVG
jgi:cell wall-associated NlpC family hydrolase